MTTIEKLTRRIRMIYNRRIRSSYQRVTRGVSDCDAWNADSFLAGQIAEILEWIPKNGHGVSMYYKVPSSDPDANEWDLDVDAMVELRDADYAKYAAIFREYQINGFAIDQKWKDEFGGVLEEDLFEALDWFKLHFQELWD